MAQLNDCGTQSWAETRGKSARQTANRKQGVRIFETDSRPKDAASFAGGGTGADDGEGGIAHRSGESLGLMTFWYERLIVAGQIY